MNFKYHKNFKNYVDNEHPDGIFVESYADHPNKLGFVLNGDYNITFPGNKHLLLTPELKDFSLRLDYAFNKLYSKRQGMFIYLRYDKLQRRGLVIYIKFEEDSLEIEYGIQRELDMQIIDRKTLPQTDCSHLALELKDNDLKLELAGHCVSFDIPKEYHNARGLIGFDRDAFNGPLMLKDITLEAECKDLEDEVLWKDHCYEFPKVASAFDSEWKFTVGATKTENFSTIDIKLTGGPAEREKIAGFNGLMPNEELVNPYLRIKTGDKERKIYIVKGKVGLVEDWDREQPGLGRADAQCPVARQIVLDEIPEDAKLYLGYEAYWREDRIDLDVALEMLIDPFSGKVIESGPYVKPNDVNIDLKSSDKKKIISLIGKDDVRYDDALEFAKNNHFFFEDEICEFSFELMFNKRDYSKEEFEFSYQLEDVFHNPLANEKKCTLKSVRNDYDPMLEKLQSAPINFDALKAGVYHLTLIVRLFGREFKRQSFAFEVMSEGKNAQCPPELSGLPVLFSHCSDNNTNGDYFDPWCGRNVNTAHYYGNCCYTSPVARKFRIWDLVHAYQRKWFMWLKPRTTKKYREKVNAAYKYEENIEELQNADYSSLDDLNYPGTYSNTRIDLLRHFAYQGVVFEEFVKFVKAENINLQHLNYEALKDTEQLSAEAFDQLLANSDIWKEWLLFISRWLKDEFHAMLVARGKKINKNLQYIDYASFPYYVATYRGAYSMLTSGVDLRNIGDDFKDHICFMEDYPYLIGYPVQRTIYTLAALKMEAPQLKIFPELYSFCGVPRDVGVRYGSPPYGVSFPAPQTVKHRLFESAYAACYFRDGKFCYWKDHGFHLRTPTAANMDVLLESWGVVHRHKPLKPLRSIAFVTSIDSALKHPDLNTEKSIAFLERFMDYINTAEEFPAYIYEQSRVAGILNGFLTRPEDIEALNANDVHTLVLPPLSTLTEEQKAAARKLYEQGVNLVCSECVDGLEDIFGVRKIAPAKVERINAAAGFEELRGITENYIDSRCTSQYECEKARPVLCGKDSPQTVLAINDSGKAKAVLFTLPPTLVRRKKLHHKVQRGGAVISEIVNKATQMTIHMLDDSPVSTTQGKLIGFEDENHNIMVIVSEDSHPAPAKAINPLVTVCGNKLNADSLFCDRDFSLIEADSAKIVIRLHLKARETAVIKISGIST